MSAAVNSVVFPFHSFETWKIFFCASTASRWGEMGNFQQLRQAVKVAEGWWCVVQLHAASFISPRHLKAGKCAV